MGSPSQLQTTTRALRDTLSAATIKTAAILARDTQQDRRVPSKSLITLAMQRYWRMTRSLTIGAQACIITPEKRVLLIRHTYRPGWHFPGGGVERNESIETALTREIREEANVIAGERPELYGVYANFRYFPSDHVALFVIRDWHQPEAPKPNHEIAEHGFFARGELPADINPPTLRRIEEIFDGKPRDADW